LHSAQKPARSAGCNHNNGRSVAEFIFKICDFSDEEMLDLRQQHSARAAERNQYKSPVLKTEKRKV
jgi:hypothetical protein